MTIIIKTGKKKKKNVHRSWNFFPKFDKFFRIGFANSPRLSSPQVHNTCKVRKSLWNFLSIFWCHSRRLIVQETKKPNRQSNDSRERKNWCFIGLFLALCRWIRTQINGKRILIGSCRKLYYSIIGKFKLQSRLKHVDSPKSLKGTWSKSKVGGNTATQTLQTSRMHAYLYRKVWVGGKVK